MDPITSAKEGNVKFFEAAELDVIQYWRDGLDNSVLSVAAKEGHLNCCEVIYRRCPQLLYETNTRKATALHKAIETRRVEIVKFLIYARAKAEMQEKGIEEDIEMGGTGDGNLAADSKLLMMVDDEECSALHYAAKHGCIESAEQLICADPDKLLLMMVDATKWTALHYAATEGHHFIAKLLIDVDASNHLLMMVDDKQRTALHWAVRENFVTITALLIYADRSKQLLTMVDDRKRTALHHAAWKGCLWSARLLIGQDPSGKLLTMVDIFMSTALHYAASEGHPGITQLLVDSDPFMNLSMMVNNQKLTALHLAVTTDSIEVAKILIDAAPRTLLAMADDENRTALHQATINGSFRSARLLVEADPSNSLLMMVDSHKRTALHHAVLGKSAAIVNLFIDADPSNRLLMMEDGDKRTALHHAVLGESVYVAKLLIDADRSNKLLMMVDGQGCTALHHAVTRRSFIAKLLIDADTSNKLLMTQDADNNTALHKAIASGHLDLAKLIITKAGPESNQLLRRANNKNETAIPLAMENNLFEFVDFLLDAFPDFALEQALSCNRISAEFWKLLLKGEKSCLRQVPAALLYTVAHNENINALANAIQNWPECLECVDPGGQNILHLACKFGHQSVVKFILGLTKIPGKLLNMQDTDGNTPLHIATSKGNTAIILSLLYDPRVDKLILNKYRKSALDAINFNYDKRRAGVYGLTHRVDEKDLKDRSDFDLLVGALISTLSFTAGITVPGGYVTEGPKQGHPALHSKMMFHVFVVSNTIALALSLSAVISHYCTGRLIQEENIIYQLKVATYCSLGAIFAMMVAFMTGSYIVLAVSHWLAITVCVVCCGFFIVAFPAMWRVIKEQTQSRSSNGV